MCRRFSTILTPEQAALLYDIVKASRSTIVGNWSPGIFEGLLISLAQIDRGGGAVLRARPTALDYGGDIIEAAVIPTSTYIAWPGLKSVPGLFWDLAAILPELSVQHHGETMVWRPVTIYQTRDPLLIIPLAAVVLPTDNPLLGSPILHP